MSDPDPKKKCCGTDCENEAGTLQCPTCLKLGVKGSYFCSQECFKKNWVCDILADILSLSNNIDCIQTTHKALMHKTQNGNRLSRAAHNPKTGSLIALQLPDFTTLFRHTHSLARSDPYIHSPRDDQSPNQSSVPTGPRLAFQSGRCA
jgi:hypothetical protein